MSKTYVGARAQSMDIGAEVPNITRVNLVVDSEHMYTAGDDTGRTLEVECPWGTQAMADSILAGVSGVQYRPYTAERALLDPAFEIGDAVTVGGLYSVIASADCTYNAAGLVNIGAPDLDEIDDEYPAQQTQGNSIKRQLAYTRSLITKTAAEIGLLVEGVDGRVTSLSTSISGIEGRVEGVEGEFASFLLDTDGFFVFDASGNRSAIRGSSIDTTTLNVDNINIDFSGKIAFTDLTDYEDVQADIDTALGYADDALAAAEDAADTVDSWRYNGGAYMDGRMLKIGTVMASSLIGGEVTLLTAAEREAGGMDITGASTSTYAIELWSYGALRMEAYNGAAYLGSGDAHVHVEEDATAITNGNVGIELSDHVWIGGNMFPNSPDDYLCGNANFPWSAVWSTNGMCETSARRKKKNITYGLERFDAFFDDMKGCSYQMVNGTSGRFHNGFIADDIRDNLAKHGISTQDFGGFVADVDMDGNPVYALRYSEFIALLVDQVQKLKARVAKLEGKKHEI